MTTDVFPDYGLIEEERRASGFYDEPVSPEHARSVDNFLRSLLLEIKPGVESLERRRRDETGAVHRE